MGRNLPRTRARRLASGLTAGLVATTAALAVLASPATAASEARFTGMVAGASAEIVGSTGGGDDDYTAGLMAMTIDGTPGAAGYCIDIHNPIDEDGPGLPEVDWASSGVPDLATVEKILSAYHPNGVGPAGYEITGTDAQKAAATQAAIWHYTDGFTLSPTDNDPVIVANYDAILLAVADGTLPGFGEPSVSLAITPPPVTEAPAGTPVGPFGVSTTAAAVTLAPSAGVTVTDGAGDPLAGPITDGTEFWLLGSDAGAVTMTASADATVHAGRVFAKHGVQRLILATTMNTMVEAEVSVQWTEVPPSTTPTTDTTLPPTTDTTIITPNPTELPPPTDTTLVVTPQPTEVPPGDGIVPEADTGTGTPSGQLPRTGDEARSLVAAAVLLLAAGGLLGLVARRRYGA